MWYLKNNDNNLTINLNTENIKLVSQNFNLLKADREELVEFLNNLTLEQVQILFNASNAIRIKHFKGNIKNLNDKKLDIFESSLSQEEFDIFFNGKLGQLPYIKKDRLQTILHEQFSIVTDVHTQEQLRDLARNIIRKNITINNESVDILTNNLTENLEVITNSESKDDRNSLSPNDKTSILDKTLDSNNLDINQANCIEPTKIINNYNNKNELKSKMEFKTMIHQPQTFSGKMGEDVDSFIENFDLAAIINNWNETEKITLLPLYLKDSASKFFKLIKTKTPNINWEQTKQQIKEKFTNIGNDKLLRIQLNQRKLMENETLNEFIINMMELCYKINPNMMEEEICEKILAGLPDEIYNKIEILDNINITKITENLKRYELAKMVRKTDEKQNSNVDKLNEEINILKKHIQQLTTDIREKPLQNHTTNYTNGTNNNSEIYNQQFPSQYCPPYFNPNQKNSNLTYNQISQNIPNTFTQQQNQYQNYQHWNPPRPIPTCYRCGKGIFSKTRNNDSITNEINHVIYSCYKINEQKHKIEILGKVNEEPTLLLLDTGASVTVIDKKVTLLENIKPINDMYLKTANDSKLNILGSTIIKIQIASLIIRHQAVVVDNLCSPILLGLDFMTKTQIVMNLKDNLILIRYENQEVKLPIETQELNNNIQGIQVHCFSHQILNEYQQFLLLSNNSEHFNHTSRYEEITGDLFSDQSSDAIAHCVSECLTMNRGIALQFRKKFNNIDNLISQKKRVREIAAIKTEKQWVLYLITKNHYYEKPTYVNIFVTLQNLRTFCLEQQIKRVALPKICAGQDGKEWPIISNMLKFIFRNTCITISIYDINKSILKNNEITDKINNNGMGFFFADNIDHTLRENILLDASYLNKIKEVPSDGDCGAHALRVCLRGEGLEVSTIEILRKINIPNTKSGYQMTEDDLAYLADHFNKNLTIISKHKNTDNNQLNTAIIYWKKNRPTIGVIHENNHWNPALINRESSPLTLHNAYIYTVIPDINTITKHINRYLDECHDRLNVSSFNEKNYSLDKYNINNPIEIKNNDVIKTPIMWYTQFCQDCEHLSTSESALKSHEYLNHPYWTEGGEVMFCDICGTYIREYRNIVMNENEKNLVDRHKKTKFHHINSLKLANRKNDNERLNYNNVPYIDKQNIDELEFDINPKLTQSQQTQLKIILNTYTDCFAKHSMELGAIDVGDVPIPTITTEPVNLPPYRLALTEQQELQRQINELLKFGLITPSISSYASPAFLVNKADGSKRLVIDYRKLNKQVPHQNFPITHMQTVFDCLEGAKFFNIMDMQQGFLNILLGTTDRYKLAFITPFGLYEWTRFPFGYKNSPRQFSKAVAKTLAGLLYVGTINYVDDIINYAKTFDDLLIILQKLLQRIRESGFKLKATKCKFGYFELKILGQIVNQDGVKPNPEGLAAIKKFPTPKTIKQTRSFLGLCNFFRKFIPRFAELISPITDLTRGHYATKKSPIKWSTLHQDAFEKLKNQLTSPPLLKHFNPDLRIIIWTDASKIGIAGTLLQKSDEDKQLHPVSFVSRWLNTTEEKYSAIELELLAIVFTLETFRTYIYGVEIEIWTDHAPLRYLDNIKTLSVRIQRLKSKIIDFDFIIKYRKGLLNQVCDAMSRNPVFDPPTYEQELQNDRDLTICHVTVINLPIEQRNDPIFNKIIQALDNPDISDQIWIRKSRNYFLNQENILMYKHMSKGNTVHLIALPNCRKNEILCNFHDHPFAAHLGIDKTYKKIIERYFWPTMYKDIRTFVTSCLSCQKRKADKTATYGHMLTSPKITGRPFERFTIDYIGPINPPSNGYSYILVGTCATTKYAIAKAYKHADSKSTVAFLIDVILQFGAIGEVHSDRGLHFTNKLVKDLLKALNIQNTNSIAYRPQSQGQTEKFNGTLIDMISHFVQEKTNCWNQYLKYVLFGYNTSVNETTNQSPFYLLHGYHPKSIFDYNLISTDTAPEILNELEKLNNIRDELPKLLEEKFLKNKKHYDSRKKQIRFVVGEKVLVKTENKGSKFAYRYGGPFKIVRQISDVTYVVEITKNGHLINDYKHVSQLKKFKIREIK
ncbi:hypothetical protein QTP88_001395 [Uroleucon formosanum]